jgi:hypothetical protein
VAVHKTSIQLHIHVQQLEDAVQSQ